MKKNAGFTLLELMITVSVAAILLAVGVPGVQEFIRNNRRAAAANELMAGLQHARSEAVKQNSTVAVCTSDNGTSCAGDTDWENGWIVFLDADDDQSVDGSETVVTYSNGFDSMTARSTFSSLTYKANGRMENSDGDEEAEFVLCDDRGTSKASTILIFRSGRPEVSEKDLNNAAPSSCTP